MKYVEWQEPYGFLGIEAIHRAKWEDIATHQMTRYTIETKEEAVELFLKLHPGRIVEVSTTIETE